eukprot:scaffold9675_cov56-Phaeocystis_antarctica.AAC.1
MAGDRPSTTRPISSTSHSAPCASHCARCRPDLALTLTTNPNPDPRPNPRTIPKPDADPDPNPNPKPNPNPTPNPNTNPNPNPNQVLHDLASGKITFSELDKIFTAFPFGEK